MAWNTGNFVQGASQGGLIPGLAAGFMGRNPEEEADKYYSQIPGAVHHELDPWAKYGMNTTQHPGERLNEIGSNYQQSPGFKFALQQALQGSGHAAAAGGMAGSPQHEQQNMGIATNLANQDYNQWIQNALNLHNTGYSQGQGASTNISEQIARTFAQRGENAYQGAANQNQAMSQGIGSLASLAAFL